jgi:hypothetical protein
MSQNGTGPIRPSLHSIRSGPVKPAAPVILIDVDVELEIVTDVPPIITLFTPVNPLPAIVKAPAPVEVTEVTSGIVAVVVSNEFFPLIGS